MKLTLNDQRHLQAAEGWLGLGDHLAANEELDHITPELRVHPVVLEVRWRIYAKAERWEMCLEIACALTKILPSDPQGWIHLGYSLRRVKEGGLLAAREALLPLVEKFPDVSTIPYNLAGYAAQMNELPEARDWLKLAFAIGKRTNCYNQIRLMALEDRDLELFWQEIPPD